MANLQWHIAWRYLFSKKGHNAINIISGISAGAVAVVTAAMICVLSVMNGFGALVEHMFSEFDPVLLMVPAEGQTFRTDAPEIVALYEREDLIVSEVVEGTALVRYKDHQVPARVMGVDSLFSQTAHIDSIITDGFYSVWDGAFDRAVLGRGLAAQIGINAHFTGALHLYAPERTGRLNLLRPDQSLMHEHAFIAGTFAVNQIEYDDQVMLVSLPLARRLFCYDSCTVTALRIQPKGNYQLSTINYQLSKILGPGYKILDRYEQQSDFFRILRIEKLLTVVLLVFILLIAIFNSIGSLSMLIIDKKEDIQILSHLGADEHTIRTIFRLEGWLISALGALLGLVLGVLLCLGQQHFGWLSLGNGANYVISAYPVMVQVTDVMMVAVIVLALGFLAAWIPTQKMKIFSLLGVLVLFVSCTRSPGERKAGWPKEFAQVYVTKYGYCYDSIPYSVVALDLYSEGLELDTAAHRMHGTGYNLYLSDIFLPERGPETVYLYTPYALPTGTYRSDTTAQPFTFLPGRDFEGTPHGIYLLYVENNQLQSIQLLDSGYMVICDTTNSLQDLQFTFYYRNVYGAKATYTTHFQGALQPLVP